MQEVIKILAENKVGVLSTVDEGKPRVRPFEFQFEHDDKYYFCTANTKDVYKQLVAMPFVEFTTTSKDYVTVRLRGEVKFYEGKVIKERIINNNDLVRSIYQSADNPVFEVFYIEHGEAIIFDFSGQPPHCFSF
ncbi:MAG: pyridoxamine 5'-phosphate oxidase [Peptococcaceae bacterium BRH_c4b]|nr:MAG: pyridoxamine 5'-phosphate oxidase [Peptococcaceae bacterium BRH_c4b]